MVFVVEKRGLWYAVESYRIPGHPYPFHKYLGPASSYPGGLKMVQRKLAAMAEKAEREKHDPKKVHNVEKSAEGTMGHSANKSAGGPPE